MRLETVFLAGCTALALAACKDALADVSDEQLIALVGDGGEPAQITRRTRECAELLGGINEVVYQDLPEEMLGLVKTDCRQMFQGWLNDPERNSMELALEDFDRADLAQRIVVLDDTQEARQAEQRAGERAVEIEAMKVELAEVSAESHELKASLQERRDILVPACMELQALRDELREANRMHDLFVRGLPNICTGEPLRREVEQIEGLEANIDSFELPAPGEAQFRVVPRLPSINLEEIDAGIVQVEEVTADYQAALAEN